MDNQINKSLIVKFLKSNNLTQKEFCEQCKISLSTLYKVLKGKNVNLSTIFKVAKTIKIDAFKLFV